MKKKHLKLIISLLSAYFVALGLLLLAESFSPDASITSFKDAVWYSLVTLTTVGYGDLFPVTMAGKLIGAIFLFLSTSLVAMLVVLAMTFSQVCAVFRLNFLQKKSWYIFSSLNPQTVSLAQSILTAGTSAVVIFPKDDVEKDSQLASSIKGKFVFFLKGNVSDALSLKKSTENCHLFFIDEDSYGNYRNALPFSGSGCNIYCMSDYAPQQTPADINLFSPYSLCARIYWQNQPLEQNTKNLVVIGGGNYANAMLEQSLLVNLFSPHQSINYHIFNNINFSKIHHRLSQVVSINNTLPDTDNLIFHTGFWADDAEILASADRILIWEDSDNENLDIFSALSDNFALKGKVHLRLAQDVPGADSYGSDNQLFTPALVMNMDTVKTAKALHNLYLSTTGANGPVWEELSVFTRKSNIAVADHIQTKIRILLNDDSITSINSQLCNDAYNAYTEKSNGNHEFFRHTEHNRWMRFHALYGWEYAPQRNNSMRQHPSMVPFDQLSEAEGAKDDSSWILLKQLADILKNK